MSQNTVLAARHELKRALSALAYNLRWSWDRPTTDLFRALAPSAWEATRNPVAVLQAASDDALIRHAGAILEAREALDRSLLLPPRFPDAPCTAYFSAEFAVAECLPIYSGGLGVLAGDHLKSSSDLGLPLVAIGLFYRYGYFQQRIDDSGYQREQYERQDPASLPITPVLGADGTALTIDVPFPGRAVRARAWRAQVGCVPLYLLDTDLDTNREDDRWITGHLYGGDQDTRIRQEIVLGIGGVRLLRALAGPSEQPRVFHLNEGHAAFAVLELARERLASGEARTFEEAVQLNAGRLAFTTHTPVAAGHDAFPADLMRAYFQDYYPALGLSPEQLAAYGRRAPAEQSERFTMTVLALRGAARRNGVAQLHGVVSRQMWGGVGLGLANTPPAVEMDAVTNGIHTLTFVGPEMASLFDRDLGLGWRQAPDNPARWAALARRNADALWTARTMQRARLLEEVDQRARVAGQSGLVSGLDPSRTLVIGFARRFATYKRASLLLTHADRLEQVLRGDPTRPVIIVFAGKAHPRDEPGKHFMQQVIHAATEERFRGRVVFLENYDLDIAHLMVQGSDVWLNTPRRPMEASGTSGMKAVLNGGLHLSELDGWWDEAYQRGIGWALGQGIGADLSADEVDRLEADQLMDLLEQEVVPLYFRRTRCDLPDEWLQCVTRSIRTLAPRFSAARMVAEYATRVYAPAAAAAARPVAVA